VRYASAVGRLTLAPAPGGVRDAVRRRLDVREIRTILWIVAIASLAITLAKAIKIGVAFHQVDFAVYLLGARHVFAGSLYTTFLAFPRKSFTYPPVAALVFIPFTALSRVPAQILWAVVSTALLVGLLFCSLRAARPGWRRSNVILWSFVLSYPAMILNPVAQTFALGQINLLVALLVLADLTGAYTLRGHSLPRGLMTGIAAALKLTPLVFVPFLFATRQAKAARVALITFLACDITMLVATPTESWSYWTKYVLDTQRVGGVVYIANQSLRSMIVRFGHAHVSEPLIALAVLLVGIAGLAVAVWAYRSSSTLLGVLLCATTGLIVSPITWGHHLVWVVPVMVWLALAPDRPAFGRVWAGLAALWFWYGPIWRVPYGSGRELHDTVAQLLVGDSYSIAMMFFVLGTAVMLMLRRSRYRAEGNRETREPTAERMPTQRSHPMRGSGSKASGSTVPC
jgi:alpha-1,2-mannosyltransferase